MGPARDCFIDDPQAGERPQPLDYRKLAHVDDNARAVTAQRFDDFVMAHHLGSGLLKQKDQWLFLCCLEEEGWDSADMWVCKVLLFRNGPCHEFEHALQPTTLFVTHAAIATSLTQTFPNAVLDDLEDKMFGLDDLDDLVFNDRPKMIGHAHEFFMAARGMSQKTVRGEGRTRREMRELAHSMANWLEDEIPCVQQQINCNLFFQRVPRTAVVEYMNAENVKTWRRQQERLWMSANMFVTCWMAVKAAQDQAAMPTDEN